MPTADYYISPVDVQDAHVLAKTVERRAREPERYNVPFTPVVVPLLGVGGHNETEIGTAKRHRAQRKKRLDILCSRPPIHKDHQHLTGGLPRL
jgi:hypothetical protein